MTDYLKRLWDWILEGKYFFFLIVIVVSIFQLDKIDFGYKTVDNIRFFGLLLQLIGTMTIVYSLKDKLFTFNKQGLLSYFWNYFKKFPLRRIIRDCRLEGNATAHATVTGDARIVKKPKEDLKDVIRYFDEEIQYIHKRLAGIKKEQRKEVDDLNTKIASVKHNLSKEINDTKELIKDTAVSNIWLETFGLACVFIGLILGTAPDIVEKII